MQTECKGGEQHHSRVYRDEKENGHGGAQSNPDNQSYWKNIIVSFS